MDEFMNSNAYVSLARNYSIIVVIAVLLGVDKSSDYLETNRKLAEARQALAANLVASFAEMAGLPKANNIVVLSPHEFWDQATNQYRQPAIATALGNAGWRQRDTMNGPPVYEKLVTGFGQFRIEQPALLSYRVNENDHQPTWRMKLNKVSFPAAAPLNDLIALYRDVWQDAPKNLLPHDIYSKIQVGIFEKRRAEIPGLGLQCSFKRAPWAFALFIMGLLVQIQNQLRRIETDPNHGADEPWLILDGKKWFERFFALSWLFVVAISALIASGFLGVIIWSDTHTAGVACWPDAFVEFGLCGIFVLVAMVVGFSTCRRMLAVRTLRS